MLSASAFGSADNTTETLIILDITKKTHPIIVLEHLEGLPDTRLSFTVLIETICWT